MEFLVANKYLARYIKEKWVLILCFRLEDFIKLHKEHRTDSTIKDAISTV